MVVPCSLSVIAVVILIVAFLVMRRKRLDKDKSMFAYDNDDYDIREDVMDYDEDGAGWCSYMFYDPSLNFAPGVNFNLRFTSSECPFHAAFNFQFQYSSHNVL